MSNIYTDVSNISTGWYEHTNANRLKQTYFEGTVDISSGSLTTSGRGIHIKKNATDMSYVSLIMQRDDVNTAANLFGPTKVSTEAAIQYSQINYGYYVNSNGEGFHRIFNVTDAYIQVHDLSNGEWVLIQDDMSGNDGRRVGYNYNDGNIVANNDFSGRNGFTKIFNEFYNRDLQNWVSNSDGALGFGSLTSSSAMSGDGRVIVIRRPDVETYGVTSRVSQHHYYVYVWNESLNQFEYKTTLVCNAWEINGSSTGHQSNLGSHSISYNGKFIAIPIYGETTSIGYLLGPHLQGDNEMYTMMNIFRSTNDTTGVSWDSYVTSSIAMRMHPSWYIGMRMFISSDPVNTGIGADKKLIIKVGCVNAPLPGVTSDTTYEITGTVYPGYYYLNSAEVHFFAWCDSDQDTNASTVLYNSEGGLFKGIGHFSNNENQFPSKYLPTYYSEGYYLINSDLLYIYRANDDFQTDRANHPANSTTGVFTQKGGSIQIGVDTFTTDFGTLQTYSYPSDFDTSMNRMIQSGTYYNKHVVYILDWNTTNEDYVCTDHIYPVGSESDTRSYKLTSDGVYLTVNNTTYNDSYLAQQLFQLNPYDNGNPISDETRASSNITTQITTFSTAEQLNFNVNATQSAYFDTSGFTAISKQFEIDHPLVEHKKLRHTSIEAPQLVNMYHGQVQLIDGKAEVSLDQHFRMTSGTFSIINKDVFVITSNETSYKKVKGSVELNILSIECEDETSTDTVAWNVFGTRNDFTIRKSNLIDASGNYIAEF